MIRPSRGGDREDQGGEILPLKKAELHGRIHGRIIRLTLRDDGSAGLVAVHRAQAYPSQ